MRCSHGMTRSSMLQEGVTVSPSTDAFGGDGGLGGFLNATDALGNTALHMAAMHGRTAVRPRALSAEARIGGGCPETSVMSALELSQASSRTPVIACDQASTPAHSRVAAALKRVIVRMGRWWTGS